MNREFDSKREFKENFLYYIGLTGSLLLFAGACNFNSIVNTVFKGNSDVSTEPTPTITIEDDTKEPTEYTDKTIYKDGSSEKTPRSGKPVSVNYSTGVTK